MTSPTAPTPDTTDAPNQAADDTARRTALQIVGAALDKKAVNAQIVDVRGKVDYCDYVVVMSGRSDRQVTAITKCSDRDHREKHGVRPLGVEGLAQARWVLMDFGDVIVHVFHDEVRGYYDLEALWMDAPRVPYDAAPAD